MQKSEKIHSILHLPAPRKVFIYVAYDSYGFNAIAASSKPVLADTIEEDGWAYSENDANLKKKYKKSSPLALLIKYMNPFWILLVVVDLLCMAFKNNSMSGQELEALNMVETIFSIAFLFEILLRMLGQIKDLKSFFQDKLNAIDFLIAIITCIIQIPPIVENRYVYVWFTGFQVLRIYRLVVAIPRLRGLMVSEDFHVFF